MRKSNFFNCLHCPSLSIHPFVKKSEMALHSYFIPYVVFHIYIFSPGCCLKIKNFRSRQVPICFGLIQTSVRSYRLVG